MNNKLSTLALFLAGVVCGFLIFEWITPTSSFVLLVSMIAVALVGIVLAVMGMGIKKQRSALSVISLVAASLSAGVIIILFGIMLIMGLGD